MVVLSDLWLKLLGVDTSGIPGGATTDFVWTHAPRSWWVFVMVAVVVALLWAVAALYRRELNACPPRIKMFLAGLRISTLLLLAVVWLGPGLAVSTQRVLEPYVVLLIDESLSMSLKDRYPDDEVAEQVAAALSKRVDEVRDQMPQRVVLVDHILNRDDALLVRELAALGKLRVLGFDGNVQQRQVIDYDSDNPDASSIKPLRTNEPVGTSTNIAQAVREALRSVSGSPIAAVVLITDGQNTEGDDPRMIADIARGQRVPLYTVGIGDPAPPRNLRVAEVWAPDSVFRDDPYLVQAQLRADGMTAATAEVQLIEHAVMPDGSLGEARSLQTKTASIGEGDARVSFEHTPTDAGNYIISVRITPQAGELLEADNERSINVKVLSDQARVLLVAGSPTWEYRMVSTLLMRDETTELSCFLQTMPSDMRQDGNTVINKLPVTAEELFEYDVLIFMDVNPSAFDQAWLDLLATFLGEHAGGFMWMSGPQYTAQFLSHFKTRQMTELLPVRIGELAAMDIEALMMTHTTAWPLRVTATGADHALLRLDKNPTINRQMWEAMPGVYWSFPAQQAKPAAQLLIEHSDPRLNRREGARPLLVAGQYGPGRTIYMGFAGTWRWRKLGEKYFDQFWIQTVRYLVEGRLLGGRKRGRIATDRDVYAAGKRVTITARLFDTAYEPLELPMVNGQVRSPGMADREVQLHAVPNQPGQYQGNLIASHVGLNELIIKLSDDDGGTVRLGRQFTVELPRVELADSRLDRQLLVDMAERSGGRYFQIDQVRELPKSIDAPTESIVIRGRPIELWDTSRVLILLVILLSVEWALRKRFKLL